MTKIVIEQDTKRKVSTYSTKLGRHSSRVIETWSIFPTVEPKRHVRFIWFTATSGLRMRVRT